jgi:hypothetical protein
MNGTNMGAQVYLFSKGDDFYEGLYESDPDVVKQLDNINIKKKFGCMVRIRDDLIGETHIIFRVLDY